VVGLTSVVEADRITVDAGAAELAGRLVGLAGLPGASGVPLRWPTDPTLLAWLRRLTHHNLYTWPFEEALARRWLGGDPYGTRVLPPAPPFLTGLNPHALPPEHVAPFLRRISLTRPTPTPDQLTEHALAADPGPLSTAPRSPILRRWGQPTDSGAPPLPAVTRIPHIVHGIWLGRPLPPTSVFWRNYAAGARRYTGRVDFVVWTDIPRAHFTRATTQPAPPPGHPDPLAAARALLTWATDNGIHLINIHEVFHATAPMTLHAQFTLEMTKQLPRGFAAASDHLRVEIIHRFGGAYCDGDMSFTPPPHHTHHTGPDHTRHTSPDDLPAFFDRLAASRHGFTMNPLGGVLVNNDVLAAPARHPAIALWLECARLNYYRSQQALFAAQPAVLQPPGGQRRSAWSWTVTPARSGRVHHYVLRLLQIRADRIVTPWPAIRFGSEFSWLPPATGEPPVNQPDHAVLTTLTTCLTFLRWQILARDGNLYLSAINPLIRGLPDPDTAWTALLTALPAITTDLPPITSLTDLRRNDDGTLEPVTLPPDAEALLDRTTTPPHWLGSNLTTREIWLLDERVTPVTLRTPEQP